MDAKSDKRAYARFYAKANVVCVMEGDQYHCYDAQMFNYSIGGMYLETSQPLQQGMSISIRKPDWVSDVSDPLSYTEHLAEVKWCKQIVTPDRTYYGAGVEYFKPNTEQPFFHNSR